MFKSSDFPELELMRAGVDLHFEILVRKFKVKVRPLTTIEVIEATAEAADAFDKLPEVKKLNITMSLMNAMYQLNKASSPDVGENGTLGLPLMHMMRSDEINALWKQYVRVCDKVNPAFEDVTAEQLKAWSEDLKKNSDPRSLLIDLSISNLISLCHHLSQISQD